MIGLVIHNVDHRRLLQGMEAAGLLGDARNVMLLYPGMLVAGTRFDKIIVVDAPEYEERKSEVWMTRYRQWIDEVLVPRLDVRGAITYLHPAGEPM